MNLPRNFDQKYDFAKNVQKHFSFGVPQSSTDQAPWGGGAMNFKNFFDLGAAVWLGFKLESEVLVMNLPTNFDQKYDFCKNVQKHFILFTIFTKNVKKIYFFLGIFLPRMSKNKHLSFGHFHQKCKKTHFCLVFWPKCRKTLIFFKLFAKMSQKNIYLTFSTKMFKNVKVTLFDTKNTSNSVFLVMITKI